MWGIRNILCNKRSMAKKVIKGSVKYSTIFDGIESQCRIQNEFTFYIEIHCVIACSKQPVIEIFPFCVTQDRFLFIIWIPAFFYLSLRSRGRSEPKSILCRFLLHFLFLFSFLRTGQIFQRRKFCRRKIFFLSDLRKRKIIIYSLMPNCPKEAGWQ